MEVEEEVAGNGLVTRGKVVKEVSTFLTPPPFFFSFIYLLFALCFLLNPSVLLFFTRY